MNNAPANDSSYQHVPVVDQMEDEEFAELDNVQSRRSKPLLLALGAVCVFAVSSRPGCSLVGILQSDCLYL